MEIPVSILTHRNLSLQKFTLCLHASFYLRANNYWPTILRAFSSVAQLCPTLLPHELHARPPCPSPTPRVYPNSCPLSWWCHPTISSSVIPFSSCSQSFLVSGSFHMSQLCTLDMLIDHHACCMLSHFSGIWLFVTLWPIACQAPLIMEFSRQEYWNGLSCPPSGNLPNPGIKQTCVLLLHWWVGSLPLVPPEKPN